MIKYKAIICDVDGTLVPYDYAASPSQKTIDAVLKAEEKIIFSIATGRSYSFLLPVLKSLQLTKGLAIINNGAQVIDLATKEILYERSILPGKVSEIMSMLNGKQIPFYMHMQGRDIRPNELYRGEKVFNIFTNEYLSEKEVDVLIQSLKHDKSLTVQKTQHKNPNLFGILISHAQATKQHGVYAVAQSLNLDPAEFIGIGDGDNDFPLLMACGFKVAMGNASLHLKAIADYIAPSVDEDGVAHVIEKFIKI